MLRIRILRQKKGIRLIDLALAIGKSLQTVSKYERGDVNVPSSELPKIAQALNVPISALFPKVREQKIAQPEEPTHASAN